MQPILQALQTITWGGSNVPQPEKRGANDNDKDDDDDDDAAAAAAAARRDRKIGEIRKAVGQDPWRTNFHQQFQRDLLQSLGAGPVRDFKVHNSSMMSDAFEAFRRMFMLLNRMLPDHKEACFQIVEFDPPRQELQMSKPRIDMQDNFQRQLAIFERERQRQRPGAKDVKPTPPSVVLCVTLGAQFRTTLSRPLQLFDHFNQVLHSSAVDLTQTKMSVRVPKTSNAEAPKSKAMKAGDEPGAPGKDNDSPSSNESLDSDGVSLSLFGHRVTSDVTFWVGAPKIHAALPHRLHPAFDQTDARRRETYEALMLWEVLVNSVSGEQLVLMRRDTFHRDPNYNELYAMPQNVESELLLLLAIVDPTMQLYAPQLALVWRTAYPHASKPTGVFKFDEHVGAILEAYWDKLVSVHSLSEWQYDISALDGEAFTSAPRHVIIVEHATALCSLLRCPDKTAPTAAAAAAATAAAPPSQPPQHSAESATC